MGDFEQVNIKNGENWRQPALNCHDDEKNSRKRQVMPVHPVCVYRTDKIPRAKRRINVHLHTHVFPPLEVGSFAHPDAVLSAKGSRMNPPMSNYKNRILSALPEAEISRLAPHLLQVTLEGDFDLVVLCHSVPQEDRQRFAHLIRGHSPRTPIIFVSPGVVQHEPSADLTIDNDPNDLISGLDELFNEQELRSK